MVSKFGPAIVNNKAHSLRLQIKAAPSLTAKDISLIKFGLCYARIREVYTVVKKDVLVEYDKDPE